MQRVGIAIQRLPMPETVATLRCSHTRGEILPTLGVSLEHIRLPEGQRLFPPDLIAESPLEVVLAMMLDAALDYARRGWAVMPLHTPRGGAVQLLIARVSRKSPANAIRHVQSDHRHQPAS